MNLNWMPSGLRRLAQERLHRLGRNRKRSSARLFVEYLEDRNTPTSWLWMDPLEFGAVAPAPRYEPDAMVAVRFVNPDLTVNYSPAIGPSPKELVIVDSATPNYQALLSDLASQGLRNDRVEA